MTTQLEQRRCGMRRYASTLAVAARLLLAVGRAPSRYSGTAATPQTRWCWRWRKRKGIATVRLPDGMARVVELHWYEATGIGRKEYKIKRFLD